ncbi:MAG: hypothetical protein ACYDCL_18095 [Myxococcales bacterium]
MIPVPPADSEITARLQAILRSDPFHRRISDDLQEWLEKGIPGALHWLRSLPPAARWTIFAACVLLLAAIALQLYLGLRPAGSGTGRGRQRAQAGEVGAEPGALAALARALAAEGRVREAARALQQAALLRLSRERGLPWRAELADWEWVAELVSVRGLAELTRAAQRLAYGPEPDRAAFAECEALYDRMLRPSATAPQSAEPASPGLA